MKFAYKTQTKQYIDQSHLVCVEHGFVVNKIHTSIKNTTCIKNRFKSVMLQALFIFSSISICIIAYVLCVTLLSTCFVKSERNTHRTHTEYVWSVYWLAFCLICKFHWFWRYNHYLFGHRRVKILACSLERSVRLLGKWYWYPT